MPLSHLEGARVRLRELKRSAKGHGVPNFDFDRTFKLMQWNLREAHLSLASITTTQEIGLLRRQHYLHRARYYLRERLLGERMLGTAVSHILDELKEAHAKPEEIGFTSEEFRRMSLNHSRYYAEYLFDLIRAYSQDRKTRRMCVRQYKESLLRALKDAGLKFEDIRINRTYFAEICKKAMA